MKASRPRLVLTALMLAVTVGRGATAGGVPSPEIRLLESAKTFRVEEEQSFEGLEDQKLPFAKVVTYVLKESGLEEGEGGLTVRVHARGNALSKKYHDASSVDLVEHYSGAHLAGWIELAAGSGAPARVAFEGHREPPFNIEEAFREPGDAPFGAVFGGFVDRLVTLVAQARGPGAAEKIFAVQDLGDGLYYEAPQLQISAALVLAEMKPPGVLEKLLAGLEGYSPPQREAAAARGLRALRDPGAIPALLTKLRDGESGLKNMERDGRWAALTGMDSAFGGEEDAGGFVEPRPEIMETLRQLDSPEKIPLLVEALQNGDSVLRRIGAALLLGHTKDQRATEPLIAALEGDAHDLVQASAANALAVLGDKRAAASLLKRALEPDGGEPKYASLRALDVLAPGMVPPEPSVPEPSDAAAR